MVAMLVGVVVGSVVALYFLGRDRDADNVETIMEMQRTAERAAQAANDWRMTR